MTTQSTIPNPPARFRVARRRGSMIVLAIGVLAVLAIVALSYTAAVRVERSGVQAYASKFDATRQVDAVVEEIGATLAADLFGNKIVTHETPRFLNPGAPPDQLTHVWPRMFEDGEYFDVPGVDSWNPGQLGFSFNTQPLGATPDPESVLTVELPGGARFEVARGQDDAWLASTEPRASTGMIWNTWPNITNLRAAHRWGPIVSGASSPAEFGWVRGDGRFVDLAQFFLSYEADRTKRGDPDADLTLFVDPAYGDNYPSLGVDQQVFGLQMSGMDELYDTSPSPQTEAYPYQHADDRFWADTDGDLRPDARWQTLDSMGSTGGLRWVVAARIIDNSSMVNVNTALHFGQIVPTSNADEDAYVDVGAGLTPADVDLLRLLRSARFAPDLVTVSTNGFGNLIEDADNWRFLPDDIPVGSPRRYGTPLHYDAVYREDHVEAALRVQDAVNAANLDNDENVDDYDPMLLTQTLARMQRDRLFRDAMAQGALNVGGRNAQGYAVENEADLRAFWGVNREDTLSPLEQRLDVGYMPRQITGAGNYDDDTGAQLLQGPLRSADRQRHARGYAETGRRQSNFELRPTWEEIRDDLRRHVTTVSGASFVSPVPVVNMAVEPTGTPPVDRLVFGDRAHNLRVAFSEFPSVDDPGAAERATDSAVRRAFEAFVWALAPLATDVPTVAGLTPLQVGASAREERFHYGGGPAASTDHPAAGLVLLGGGSADTSYALLRAASLAVNLADALDRSSLQGPMDADPTRDAPTIARLFPQALTADGLVTQGGVSQGLVDGLRARAMPILTLRLPQGDVPTAAAPPAQYVGAPNAGVTLVGLDRQPFLREVAALAVYRDDLLTDASVPGSTFYDSEISASREDEQLGSVIAFELGNPWPQPISVKDYVVRLTNLDGDRWVQIRLSGLADADAVIAPGSFAVYHVQHGSTAHPMEWDAVYQEWIGQVSGALTGTAAPFPAGFEAGADPAVQFDSGSAPSGGVMFYDWNGAGALQTRALLIFDPEFDISGAALPPVLVDRMSPPASSSPFPAQLADEYGGTFTIVAPPTGFPPTTDGTGYVAIASSFTRRVTPPTVGSGAPTDVRTGGFPPYIVERPEDGNDVSPAQAVVHIWAVGTGPFDPEPVVDIAAGGNNLGLGVLGDMPKGQLPGMPSIQFFVPNRGMDAVGDLAMLSAFTHFYVHSSEDLPDASWAPEAEFGSVPGALGLAQQGAWTTIGEQLGADMHFTYNGQVPQFTGVNPLTADNANPYLGVLDPTRFVLGDGSSGTVLGPVPGLPDALAVPLATRVFDCFEALRGPGDRATLAMGRVNVNTAPRRTLRMIPFMSPEEEIVWPYQPGDPIFDGSLSGLYIGGAPDAGFSSALSQDRDRAGLLARYRDARQWTPSDRFERSTATNIAGLRAVGWGSVRPVDGVVNAGELSILARWQRDPTPTPEDPSFSGGLGTFIHFGELGSRLDAMTGNRFNTGVAEPPLPATFSGTATRPSHVVPGAGRVDGVLDRYPNAIAGVDGGTDVNLDPIDDIEERAAVYRAMSNVVSTRSDVFTAWFVIRGYDPARISAIAYPSGVTVPNADELAFLMNQLSPTHESRWLAVFDRSNVRQPTDRPRLLLLTRLPTR